MRLAGRVAIVTECGRGESFGVVWARALAREGAAVLVADRDPARADEVCTGLAAGGATVAATALDVGTQASCDELVAFAVARFGRVDVLANTQHVWDELRGDDAS